MTGEIPLNFKTNPYKRVEWEDDLTDPNTGEVLEEGTIFGRNMEIILSGVFIMHTVF